MRAILNRAIDYIRAHWQGRQSLAWSFWVNVAAVAAVIYGIQTRIRPPTVTDPETAYILNGLLLAVSLLVILPWQVVGTLRACKQYQQDGGTMALALGSYVGLAVLLMFTSSAVFDVWQAVYRPGAMEEANEITVERWARERASRYTLKVSEDGTRVILKGSIELGVTRVMRTLLAGEPKVKVIELHSAGGHIYEGRGLAQLVLSRKLDTHAPRICASACVTIFVAGKDRSIGPGARIGFHQYALRSTYGTPFDLGKEEQEKDRAFFAARGVDPAFLSRIFDKSHDDIWYPPTEDLLAARVVHRIARNPAE